MTSVWGREVNKVWQKSKNKKNGEKIWLEGGRGGRVKLQENRADVICE